MTPRTEPRSIPAPKPRHPAPTIAICTGEFGRLEASCRALPNARRADLLSFDCASAIEAALKGLVDILVVDWSLASPARLTALNLLRGERSRVRIYFAIEEPGIPLHLAPWESVV